MLVLNATFEPINVCTVRRAVVLLLKEKAEVVERSTEWSLRSERSSMSRPLVIRLRSYVKVPRDTHPLLGIPLGIKDNLVIEGVKTTCASTSPKKRLSSGLTSASSARSGSARS